MIAISLDSWGLREDPGGKSSLLTTLSVAWEAIPSTKPFD